jgi:hypothetical protein
MLEFIARVPYQAWDPGSYATQYGQYGSLADLLRQIGHDERTHKQGSLINMRTPRLAA